MNTKDSITQDEKWSKAVKLYTACAERNWTPEEGREWFSLPFKVRLQAISQFEEMGKIIKERMVSANG